MKNLFFSCLLLVFVIHQVSTQETCTAGESFIADDGCNTCHCPPSGLKSGAPCTLMACIENCRPGVYYKSEDGCNTCYCPSSGLKSEAYCTIMACVDDATRP